MRDYSDKGQELLRESEEWETGQRGKDSRALSIEEEQNLESTLKLQMVSLRLPIDWIEAIKQEASKKGLKYQPYIRHIIGEHLQKLPLEIRISRLEDAVFKKAAGG